MQEMLAVTELGPNVFRNGDEREGGGAVAFIHLPVRSHDAESAAVRYHVDRAVSRSSARGSSVLPSPHMLPTSCRSFEMHNDCLSLISLLLALADSSCQCTHEAMSRF